MRAILVRVGIDQTYGCWNAPVDPQTGRFVYVPIPDNDNKRYRPGCERKYDEILPALGEFGRTVGLDLEHDFRFPRILLRRRMHLDPDFDQLTYGDNGARRGSAIRRLVRGDLLAFYAGLKSIEHGEELNYALVGLYVVEEVVRAIDVSIERRHENAHTRWNRISNQDIVLRGQRGLSGRLEHCIGIGEWRRGAYRVRRDVLWAWGGLSVQDGFIQRSVRPPLFLNAAKFYRWFMKQNIPLVARNN